MRDPNPPVLHWSLMFTGWEWSPGATVSLSPYCPFVQTAFIWCGHCSCRHNNSTTLHNIPKYGLQQTRTYNVSCYNIVIQAMYSIIHICTSYRVLYNIYCDVYQESNQKLFKLIALRILKSIHYLLCAVCSRQRSKSTFNIPSLSNFRI